MTRLITASLIGSIEWYKNCPSSWKAKAAKDLQNSLARIYTEPMSEAVKRGIAFEDDICKRAVFDTEAVHVPTVQTFVDECKGGEFQKKTKRFVFIDGFEYCLYGKIDVAFPDMLKDLKTTGKWKGEESYLNTFQHKLYCYNEHISKFRYVVGVFDDKVSLVPDQVYTIDYEVEDWAKLEKEVYTTVINAVKFLSTSKTWLDLYTHKFSQY